jgi:hypothetical protein
LEKNASAGESLAENFALYTLDIFLSLIIFPWVLIFLISSLRAHHPQNREKDPSKLVPS